MRRGCLKSGCSNRAEFSCSCLSVDFLVCSSHMNDHITRNTTVSVSHLFAPLFLPLNESEKNSFVSEINQMIQKIEKHKTLLSSLIKDFMSSIDDYLKKLSRHQIDLKIALKLLCSASIIYFPFDSSGNIFRFSDSIDYALISKQILTQNLNSNILDQNSNLQIFLKKGIGLNSHQEKLYFTKSDKFLYCFNPETEEKTQVFEHSEFSRRNPSLCAVDNKSLFIYGGYKSGISTSALVVDLKTQNIRPIPDGFKRSQAAALKIKDRIYVFGGCSESAGIYTKKASYFDLMNNDWVDITELPIATRNTSTVLIGEKVLISTTHFWMFLYEVSTDSYQEFRLEFEIDSNHILGKSESHLYLISNSGIYRNNGIGYLEWNRVNSGNISCTVTCKAVISVDKSKLYFADAYGGIYRFKFCDERLDKIRN